MNRNKKQQSQGKQRSSEQRSRERKEKQLTLEDLASVTGGFISPLLDPSAKAEDRSGNKAEADGE